MNKTVKVCISKFAFNIEESAYKKLEQYLETLKNHFETKASGKEILEEIEERIAEILSEKCGNDGVVSESMVNEVIEILGSAAQIDTDDEAPKAQAKQEPKKTDKKLFRDTSNKILGGVCSGIAAYWGLDPVLIRVIFIFSSLLISVPLALFPIVFFLAAYTVLWIIIPEAKTVTDRYQMRGETNTIESISRQVESGAKEIGRSAKKFANNNRNLFSILGRAIAIVIGIAFILASAISLITILLCSIGVVSFPASLFTALSGFLGVQGSTVGLIAFIEIISIPLILLLYWGILMTFNMKVPKWKPGLWLLMLWLVALVSFCVVVVRAGVELSHPNHFDVEEVYSVPQSLTIEMEGADESYDYVLYEGDRNDYQLIILKDNLLYAYPEIRIRRSDENILKVNSEKVVFRDRKDTEFFSYQNDTLTVKPMVFSKYRSVNELSDEIVIELPYDTPILLKGVRNHDFKSHDKYSNIFGFRYLDF